MFNFMYVYTITNAPIKETMDILRDHHNASEEILILIQHYMEST